MNSEKKLEIIFCQYFGKTGAKNGQSAFSFNLFSLFSGNTLQGANAMNAE